MIIEYTLGLDISGSTNGIDNYWLTVEEIYNKYNITKIIIWNIYAEIINSTKLLDIIKNKQGQNGTNISCFVDILINQNIKENIILITDGQILINDVIKADKLFENNNYKLNNVLCFILHDGEYDYSVIAPFRRNNINSVYQKNICLNDKLILEQSISEYDIKIINDIDNIELDTFETNYTQIENTLIAQTMGKGNDILKLKLIELKKRLIRELSKLSSNKNDSILELLEKNKNINFDSILFEPWQEVIKIHNNYNNNCGLTLESKINKLISYCENKNILKINNLKSKLSISKNIQDIDNIIDDDNIICPISFDNDNMVIMIYDGPSIFSSLTKNEIDFISNNPLNILNMPLIIENIKNRIGHVIGLNTLKNMSNKLLDFNPFNREKIIGCISFINEINNITYSNHIIRLLFSDGKIIGNITFYYAVLYFIIQNINFIDTDIKNIAKDNLIYRLKNTKTYMSCCGLGNYVTTQVSVASSLFYIVNSGLLKLKKTENILKYHLSCILHMIDLLKILNYPIHSNALKYIDYQFALFELSKMFKENKYFNLLICGLYKNMIKIEQIPYYIQIDGDASKEQINEILELLPKSCKKISIHEIITLANMINSNLLLDDFKLNLIDINNKIIWNYIIPDNFEPIKICLSTGRPYYKINDKTWIDVNESKIGIKLKYQFNGYKYVLAYILKYKKFPTKLEYLLFCSKKHPTLPQQIEYFYDIIYKSYEDFNNYYDLSRLELLYGYNNKFIDIKYKIIFNSCSIKNRLLLEKQNPEIYIINILS